MGDGHVPSLPRGQIISPWGPEGLEKGQPLVKRGVGEGVRDVGIGPSSHRRFGDGVSYARWEATPRYFLLLCAALAACIRSTGRIITAMTGMLTTATTSRMGE